MKIEQVGSNMTELILGNGTVILFSYKTPVACWKDGTFYRTETYYSKTTTKHINKWLPQGVKAQTAGKEFFDILVAK
jgi:hypothetical protein